MTTTTLNFEQFRALMMAAGCDEVLEREWAPGTAIDTHTHPFLVNALLIRGRMWLAESDGAERLLQAGDTFSLAAEVPHRERYCAEQGATYWVARKHAGSAAKA